MSRRYVRCSGNVSFQYKGKYITLLSIFKGRLGTNI